MFEEFGIKANALTTSFGVSNEYISSSFKYEHVSINCCILFWSNEKKVKFEKPVNKSVPKL